MNDRPTSDRLRHDIDSGSTGEKVGFPDPATAPLGTDAEAGGHPPTGVELGMDAASRPVAVDKNTRGILPYIIALGVLAALAIAIVMLAG